MLQAHLKTCLVLLSRTIWQSLTSPLPSYIAVINGAEGAGTLLSFGPNMAQAAAAANRILSFRIRAKTEVEPALELQDASGGVKIELRDLWFKYPTRDIPIFTGLNITIEKGQFAALVGPSGCGKTSIVSLLERYDHHPPYLARY